MSQIQNTLLALGFERVVQHRLRQPQVLAALFQLVGGLPERKFPQRGQVRFGKEVFQCARRAFSCE